jgi:hypothetical protein
MLRIAAPKVAPTELHASACRTVGEETIYYWQPSVSNYHSCPLEQLQIVEIVYNDFLLM